MNDRMRVGRAIPLLMALLGAATAAAAEPDIFAVGRCRHVTPEERAAMVTLDEVITERSAAWAAAEVQRRVAAPLSAPVAPGPSPRALAMTIEGWLFKKAWLGARARHEHDADEAAGWCDFLLRENGTTR